MFAALMSKIESDDAKSSPPYGPILSRNSISESRFTEFSE